MHFCTEKTSVTPHLAQSHSKAADWNFWAVLQEGLCGQLYPVGCGQLVPISIYSLAEGLGQDQACLFGRDESHEWLH